MSFWRRRTSTHETHNRPRSPSDSVPYIYRRKALIPLKLGCWVGIDAENGENIVNEHDIVSLLFPGRRGSGRWGARKSVQNASQPKMKTRVRPSRERVLDALLRRAIEWCNSVVTTWEEAFYTVLSSHLLGTPVCTFRYIWEHQRG